MTCEIRIGGTAWTCYGVVSHPVDGAAGWLVRSPAAILAFWTGYSLRSIDPRSTAVQQVLAASTNSRSGRQKGRTKWTKAKQTDLTRSTTR